MARAVLAAARLATALLSTVSAASAIAGCGKRDVDEDAVVRVAEPTAEPAWNTQVRRPPWTFVFEKMGPRCTIYRIDAGERKTKVDEAACPVDMEIGERYRLAGKTCLREGGGTEREIPVTCPDPLTNAESDFLEEKRKKGELGP